jgi:hypothetical protein
METCQAKSDIKYPLYVDHEYEASAEITIRKGKAPPGDPAAHDARTVADDTLGPHIKRGSGFSIY